MFITNSGDSLEGGKFVFLGQVSPDVAVSSITFSGIDGDQDRVYGLSFYWKNPLTGSRKLLFKPNSSTPPAGSSCFLQVYEAISALLSNLTDADFPISTLVAASANTAVNGALFVDSRTLAADGSPLGRSAEMKGYAEDQEAIVGVRRKHFRHRGHWNDANSQWTSITIEANPPGNGIDAGSDFRLWKVA